MSKWRCTARRCTPGRSGGAAALGVIMLGKPLAALSIMLLLGYPSKVALAVAVTLAQIGEFSFILAALGKELGLLTDAATNTLVAAPIEVLTRYV